MSCGFKYFNVPNFIFGDICRQHDEDYAQGGSELDRLASEYKFLKRMLKRSISQKWYSVPFYILISIIYPTTTLVIGWTLWNYGK